jgi:hypothetical protein
MKTTDLPNLPPADWVDDYADEVKVGWTITVMLLLGLIHVLLGLGLGYLIWS